MTVVAQDKPIPWSNPRNDYEVGVTHHTLYSKANKADIGYCLGLPPSYEGKEGRLPLLIFLHGAGGSETSDAGPGGYFRTVLDNAPPCGVLFVNGRMSRYADHPDRGEFVESFLMKELLPYIERRYRLGGRKELRFLSGFSMGGVGTVALGLKYPNLFAGGITWGGSMPKAGLAAAEAGVREWGRSSFRFFAGVGSEDGFAQADGFRDLLGKSGVKHIYRVLPGVGHDLGAYYRLTAKEAFAFVMR